jgi:hypothetical protein
MFHFSQVIDRVFRCLPFSGAHEHSRLLQNTYLSGQENMEDRHLILNIIEEHVNSNFGGIEWQAIL